jgi:zinc D-Ala-D-Ala carboxypeptidase
MSKIFINRYSIAVLSPYFKEHEFFCKCPDFKENSHILDHELIVAAHVIREYVDSPVLINSSYRTKKCNEAQGGAENSYHLKGMALDISCPLNQAKINDSVSNRGYLYVVLRRCGINGFGISKSFLHIDTRPSGTLVDTVHGSYELWYY